MGFVFLGCWRRKFMHSVILSAWVVLFLLVLAGNMSKQVWMGVFLPFLWHLSHPNHLPGTSECSTVFRRGQSCMKKATDLLTFPFKRIMCNTSTWKPRELLPVSWGNTDLDRPSGLTPSKAAPCNHETFLPKGRIDSCFLSINTTMANM